MSTKCLYVDCTKPVVYEVTQKWNGKVVHTCEAHKPGVVPGRDKQWYEVEAVA